MTGQQLRNSILQEAIHGRLVPNTLQPGELTARELLNGILAARQKAENEAKGKRAKNLTLSKIEEEPWELPEGWCWCRLGDLCETVGSKDNQIKSNQIKEDGKFPVISQGQNYIDGYYDDESKLISIHPVIMFGDHTRNVKHIDFPFIIGADGTKILMPFDTLDSKWLFYTIKFYAENVLYNRGYARHFTLLSKEHFPLPPLSIQHSIVSKIEELLPLVEEYDAAQGELKALNESLPDKLRKSVLQEAIHGRLVPNTLQPGELTASELLNDILAARQKTENETKGKKAKKLTLSKIEEEPWELPEGWCWCRLGDIGAFINGDRGKNYPSKDKLHATGTIPFISAINMQNLTLRHDNLLFLDDEQYEKLGSGKLRKQDIVICIRGSLGKFCIYPLNIGAIASSLVIFRLTNLALLKYVTFFINSVGFTNQIVEHDNGTAQPNLSAKDVSNFFLPLPPLSIQHSIVSKIEEIFKLLEK